MATSTSATAILSIDKSFTYRGAREIWSNAYHLDQIPPDTTTWGDLAGKVWALEQAFLPPDCQVEAFRGHTPGTPPVLVWESDPAPAGEGGPPGLWVPTASFPPCPGDAAMWIRYNTTQKTIRGKPIYLRNYYHCVHHDATPDVPASQQVTALNAMGTAFVNGIVSGGITYRRAGPRGAVAQGHSVGPYVTTRTLKARGKRRKTGVVGSPSTGYFNWKLVPVEIN